MRIATFFSVALKHIFIKGEKIMEEVRQAWSLISSIEEASYNKKGLGDRYKDNNELVR